MSDSDSEDCCVTCSIVSSNSDTELSLPVGDWVWDCQWLNGDPACQCINHTSTDRQLTSSGDAGNWNQLIAGNTGDRYHLAAALGHNSVTLCCWWVRSILQHVSCSDSSILYLLYFHLNI